MTDRGLSQRAGWRWLLTRVARRYLSSPPRAMPPPPGMLRAREAGGRYEEVLPAGRARFEAVPLWPVGARWLWAKGEEIDTTPRYRVELVEAAVCGVQGQVVTGGGALIGDVFGDEPPAHDFRPEPEAGERRLAGTCATLAMPNHTNYFHWLWQGVSRAALLGPVAGRIDHWITPPPDRGYVRETLAALGIAPEKIVAAGPGVIRCERLWVPSQPMVAGFADARAWPAQFIQGLFPAREAARGGRRLLVVRGAVSARQLINEQAVAEQLARHGFERLSMDGLSVAEQAGLFGAAEAVVAVHGAALANLIFCRPGTRIIELVPRNWPSPLYARLSQSLGLRYHGLAGAEPALRWAPIKNLAADLRIEPRELDEVLREAGLS